MTAPDVNADVRARFERRYSEDDVRACAKRMKFYDHQIAAAILTEYADKLAAHADLSGEVREWHSIETPPAVASTASHPVLVYVPEFGVRMGWYTKAYADKGEWPWSADGFCDLTNQTITYWMPRPEPPAALAAQGQGEPVADLEPFREAIVFACTNGNMDKWRRVLASFDSFAYRYKRNTHPAPAASPAGVPDGWAEAYAAFKGAFDTPAAWRRDDSEYANDARKRLRELNDSFLAAPSAPEGDGGAAHG